MPRGYRGRRRGDSVGDKRWGEKPQSGAGEDGTHGELPPTPLCHFCHQISTRRAFPQTTGRPGAGSHHGLGEGIRRGKGKEQHPCIRPSPCPGRGRIPPAPVTGTNPCGTARLWGQWWWRGEAKGSHHSSGVPALQKQHCKRGERRGSTQPTPLCHGDAGAVLLPSPRRAVAPQGCCGASDLLRAVTQPRASCAFGTPESAASPFHFPHASPAAGAGGWAQP